MPAPQKLAHVVLTTNQIDAMTKWYCTVLSARIQHQSEVATFLTYDEEHHRIALAQIDGAQQPQEGSTGLSHIAFTFDDLDGLLTTFAELRDEGITPHWTVNHGTTSSLYYADPDHNLVELQVDNFATAEEGNEYLRSEQFAANPIGVRFEPEQYLKRLRSGESSAELIEELARVEGEPVGPPA
ncbi:VOC family protein [Amycolatopsis ultiminotia]|uniref:VOC family protein n=1 Tax=Amycolatopsis ultiminotia TaxID=543629 RepID=A0ABP6V5G2_9PSEU